MWKSDNQGVKEEPFTQTGSRGGDAQLGQRGCSARSSLENQAVPHLHVDKLVGTVMAMGETPSLTREFFGEAHSVLEQTQTHPPKNQHQKGPIYLWVAGKVTERRSRAEQGALLPLGPSPTYSATTHQLGCSAMANT